MHQQHAMSLKTKFFHYIFCIFLCKDCAQTFAQETNVNWITDIQAEGFKKQNKKNTMSMYFSVSFICESTAQLISWGLLTELVPQ